MKFYYLIILIITLSTSNKIFSQSIQIRGKVLDYSTNQPVPHFSIKASTGGEVKTDEKGQYKIDFSDDKAEKSVYLYLAHPKYNNAVGENRIEITLSKDPNLIADWRVCQTGKCPQDIYLAKLNQKFEEYEDIITNLASTVAKLSDNQSLVDEINSAIEHYKEGNIDLSKKSLDSFDFEKELEKSQNQIDKTIENNSQLIQGLRLKAQTNYAIGDWNQAEISYQKLLQYSDDQLNDQLEYSQFLFKIGNNNQAFKKALEAISYAENQEDSAYVYSNLASFHYYFTNFSQAEDYFSRSLSIYQQLDSLNQDGLFFTNQIEQAVYMGACYLEQNATHKVGDLKYWLLATDSVYQSNPTTSNLYNLMMSNQIIGGMFFSKGQNESAGKYFKESLEIISFLEEEDPDGYSVEKFSVMDNLGALAYLSNDHLKAIQYFKQALEIAEEEISFENYLEFDIDKVTIRLATIELGYGDENKGLSRINGLINKLDQLKESTIRDRYSVIKAKYVLGQYYLSIDNHNDAKSNLKQAYDEIALLEKDNFQHPIITEQILVPAYLSSVEQSQKLSNQYLDKAFDLYRKLQNYEDFNNPISNLHISEKLLAQKGFDSRLNQSGFINEMMEHDYSQLALLDSTFRIEERFLNLYDLAAINITLFELTIGDYYANQAQKIFDLFERNKAILPQEFDQEFSILSEKLFKASSAPYDPVKALHHAIHKGDVSLVKSFLDSGTPIDSRFEGRSCLEVAFAYGDVAMVEMLLGKGANMEDQNQSGSLPQFAIEIENTELIEILGKNSSILNQTIKVPFLFDSLQVKFQKHELGDTMMISPLMLAVSIGVKPSVTSKLIELTNSINYSADNGMTALHNAVLSQDTANASLLLKNGAHVNCKSKFIEPPLYFALFAGDKEMSKLLIAHGADVSTPFNGNTYPAHLAALFGYTDLLKVLNENSSPMDEEDYNQFTPLLSAAMGGFFESVNYLLSIGSNPKSMTKSNYSLLHYSVFHENISVSKAAIEKGLNIHRMGTIGLTPLIIAAMKGNLKLIKTLIENSDHSFDQALYEKPISYYLNDTLSNSSEALRLLLDYGFNPNHTDKEGFSALYYCVYGNSPSLAEVILRNGGNVADKDDLSFRLALADQNLQMVKLLYEYGADIHAKLAHGNTALHMSVAVNDLRITEYLLSKNVNVNSKQSTGLTAIHLAVLNESLPMVKYLNENGADIHAQDSEGKTPLHLAIFRSNPEIAKYLLELGADKNKPDANLSTPYDNALLQGNTEMISVLEKY